MKKRINCPFIVVFFGKPRQFLKVFELLIKDILNKYFLSDFKFPPLGSEIYTIITEEEKGSPICCRYNC